MSAHDMIAALVDLRLEFDTLSAAFDRNRESFGHHFGQGRMAEATAVHNEMQTQQERMQELHRQMTELVSE